MKADALTIEDIAKLIDCYEECIEHAFDVLTGTISCGGGQNVCSRRI